MKQTNPDLISICTPPDTHYEQMMELLKYKSSILCEKPLFWNNLITNQEFYNRLKLIESYKTKNILINTCNSSFITQIKKHIDIDQPIKDLTFTFNTKGKHRKENIGVDLLPHGLSILIELCGHKKINDIKKNVTQNRYSCEFNYGNTRINFIFNQGENIDKKLSFKINDNIFERLQINEDGVYKVFIVHKNNNESYKMIDPFEYNISRFINNHLEFNNSLTQKHINDSIHNMKLMKLLIKK